MDGIREYLISVIATALLCGIITTMLDGKGAIVVSIKMLAGLVMLLAVIRPLTSISPDHLFRWTEDISADGTDYAAYGEEMAMEAYRTGIMQQTEAYILDEAAALGCNLSVEVILSQEDVPKPCQVRLSGEASPYARKTLTSILTERLGIKREDQIWI